MSVLSMSPHTSALSNTLPTTPTMSSLALSPTINPNNINNETSNNNTRSLRPRHLANKSTTAARIRSPYARPRAPASSKGVSMTVTSSVTPKSKHKKKPSSSSATSPTLTQSNRKAILAAAAISAGGEGTPGHVGARSGSLVRRPSVSIKSPKGMRKMHGPRGKKGSSGGSLAGLTSVAEQENLVGGEKENSSTSMNGQGHAFAPATLPPGKMIWVQDQAGNSFQVCQPDSTFQKQMLSIPAAGEGPAVPVEMGALSENVAFRSVSMEMLPRITGMTGTQNSTEEWQPSTQSGDLRQSIPSPYVRFAIPGVPLSHQQPSHSHLNFNPHPQPHRRNPPAHLMSTDPRAALSRSSTQMAPMQVLQARQYTEHRIQPSFASSVSSGRSTSGSSVTFQPMMVVADQYGSPAMSPQMQMPNRMDGQLASEMNAPEVKLEAMDLTAAEKKSAALEKEFFKASVPLTLPMPPIAEVDVMALGDDDLAQVPLPYILASLRDMSTGLFASSNLYRPSPFHASTAETQSSQNGLPNQMKWILPEDGKMYAEQAGLVKRMEPTHVLAVKGMQGKEIGGENKGRLILIHHLIYAAQCAHFPRFSAASDGPNSLPSISPTTSITNSETSVPSTIVSEYVQKLGGTILESDACSRRSSIRSTGTTGAEVPEYLMDTIDLPLIHLSLPCPSLMPILHTWLYIQQPQVLLTNLLDLTASHQPTPIATRLSALGTIGILSRLKRVHGLWQNVVCWGVSDKDLWKVMQTAWKLLVTALQVQGSHASVLHK